MMEQKAVYAGADKSRLIKNTALMAVVGLFTIAGIILFLYNIVKFNIIFCIIALIGTFIGTAVLIIRYNAVFTRHIGIDDTNVYIRTWENGFFSYDIMNETELIRDFIPAKTEKITVPVKEIKRVLIGTPSYLKKSTTGKRFSGIYDEVYSRAGEREKGELDKGDVLYISTKKGAMCFLPVSGLDREKITDILVRLDKREDIEIKSSDRNIARRLAAANESKYRRKKMEIIPDNLAAADIINKIENKNIHNVGGKNKENVNSREKKKKDKNKKN